MTCPICDKDYSAIDRAGEVCWEHEDWIVSKCPLCGRVRFTKKPGKCFACKARQTLKNKVQGMKIARLE